MWVYWTLLGLAVLVALVFVLIVFATGKGDAMSGGSSSIRTTYRGKASFEDQMSRLTLILGGSFIVLMLILDLIASRVFA